MSKMSVNDDCELHDLVKQTLEKSGSISKIRAELRASIFVALQENDCFQNSSYRNHDLQHFVENEDGILLLCLIREFLDHFGLSFTTSVFDPELASYGIQCTFKDHKKLRQKLNLSSEINDGKQVPVLCQILRTFWKTETVSNGEKENDKLSLERDLVSTGACDSDAFNETSPRLTNTVYAFNEMKNTKKKFDSKNNESPTSRNTSKQFSSDTRNNLMSSDFSTHSLSLLGNLPPLSQQCQTLKENSLNESMKQLNKLKTILKDSALPVNDDSNSSIFSGDNDEQCRETVKT